MIVFQPAKLIETIERIVRQIETEFPQADLLSVGRSVADLARQAEERSTRILATNLFLRICIVFALALGLVGAWFVVAKVRRFPDPADLFAMFQGLEAMSNVIILAGASVFSIVTLEARWQRNAALHEISKVVSVIHIIDMHQLGKHAMIADAVQAGREHLAPDGQYTLAQILRYFDLCSDLMSLAAKIALIYEVKLPISAVSDAVTDAAQLATALSNETYQKMMLLDRPAAIAR